MGVTEDRRLDTLKWQTALKLVRANEVWQAALHMWGIDSEPELEARKQMRTATEAFKRLQYK